MTSTAPLRVLHVNDLPAGPGSGAEVHLARLLPELERRGITVELFAGDVRHDGIRKVLDVWDPWARRALARKAAAFRPDVVHLHNVARELSASVFGVPPGAPAVHTLHDHRLLGVPDGQGTAAAVRALKSRLDLAVARRNVDVAVGVSEPLAADLRAAGFRRVEHLPPMVDPGFDGEVVDPARCADVVFVGRLAVDKGFDVLLQAFDRLLERHPEATLRVVGDGELRAAAEAAGSRNGRIELLGRLDAAGVQQVLARAMVVAVPSVPRLRREGLPTVALEAAALGRPLVVSDDPGLAAFVRRSGAGEIVPAESVDALAAAIDRVMSDPGRATAFGAAAASFAAGYCSTKAVTDGVQAIYAELCGR